MTFNVGQRWISNAESDLGLGTIIAIESRTLTLLFPASGERRLYSINEAPITRVRFNIGDQILSQDNTALIVNEFIDENNLLTYIGTNVATGQISRLQETQLSNFLTFNKPQDKLFAGQIDKFYHFSFRYKALIHQNAQQKSNLRGLFGPRVNLIPHQFYIAKEVGKRHAPRILLADEVGLGKTIEAGLIIHQQLITGRADRVLIALPENLQHQWLVEMIRRFNLHFSIFDDEICVDADAKNINPFETEQLVLCSLALLCKKNNIENALKAKWDLLIVDEAHHLIWNEHNTNREYQVIEALSKNIPGVLLLTATPDQLGHESHFARLRLLDPSRFYNYQAFVKEEYNYKPIVDAVNKLLNNKALTHKAQNNITELLNEQDVQPLLSIITNYPPDNEQRIIAQNELITNLLDRHGTSRLFFRNTRASINGFPNRILTSIALTLPKQYEDAIKATKTNEKNSVEMQAYLALYPEQIYQTYKESSDPSWYKFDPRISWLIELIQEKSRHKILIITAQSKTALALEEALRTREGIYAAVFHEGLSLIERDKAAAYFAQDQNGAQVMICSEIGSEGRNFQFSHNLVLFDLPINPDLLEQRIGRLDRIGQRFDIKIYTPYLKNTSQEFLQKWYQEGLQAFEHTTPTGQTVYQQIRDDLHTLLANGINKEGELNDLIQATKIINNKLKKQLEQGRDRLLEINSSGILHTTDLINDIKNIDKQNSFTSFALQLFDVLGVDHENTADNCLILRPTDHMLTSDLPGLPEEGLTITFNRQTALIREDVHYLNHEHPMITSAMEMILTSDTGTTSVAILKNSALPTATTFLELIYIVQALKTENAQLSRFLPTTPIRLLLDKNGKNLSSDITFDKFNRQLSPISRNISHKIVNTSQPLIRQLIKGSQSIALGFMVEILKKAKNKMQLTLRQEQDRLQALQAVNPNIRKDEIQFLLDQQSSFEHILDQTRLKLDSIRFIVSTKS
ncbi:MAG: RNA polymerase-associated protein RapA [Psychromonas sp.]|nr:RNA polymerase-associated protein RapA [Psychromonas sp.]